MLIMDLTSAGLLNAKAAAGAALIVATLAPVAAADYPTRPVRLVTGSAPGGGSDFVARALAERLSERFGQSVIVDNRAGAGGSIGADIVAKSAPDGYTLLVSTGSAVAVNPALQKLPYVVERDLAPVSLISTVPFALVVNPALPAKSVSELIRLARSQPGRVSYASSGIGAMSHLSMELFKSMAGVNLVHVPYRGSSPAAIDLIGGQVQASFNNLIPTLPHVKSGRLRALGVSGRSRALVLPDVPTVAESGLPGYESTQWYGVLLPGGGPRSMVSSLNREFLTALQNPMVRARLLDEGGNIVGSSPEEFAAFIRAETVKWTKVVKDAHLRAE
jgi:tripartite-type tricarboxylate transporter receptor subunit TctC